MIFNFASSISLLNESLLTKLSGDGTNLQNKYLPLPNETVLFGENL